MKRFNVLLSAIVLIASVQACVQNKKSPKAMAEGTISGAEIKISYHQPSARGRTMIGGEKVPYGVVWRTGANNATTFEASSDIKVGGETLPKGIYGLYTIPDKEEWTVIFNSVSDLWGKDGYDESKDVLRVKVSSSKPEAHVETFIISVVDDGMVLAWENSEVKVPIE
ncbi:MAG: DUF2911 domain-containing protein [Bacteroidota bacterium]